MIIIIISIIVSLNIKCTWYVKALFEIYFKAVCLCRFIFAHIYACIMSQYYKTGVWSTLYRWQNWVSQSSNNLYTICIQGRGKVCFRVYVCACGCVCVWYIYVCVSVCTVLFSCMTAETRKAWYISFCRGVAVPLRQELSLNLKITTLAKLAGQQSPIPPYPGTEVMKLCGHIHLFM